MLYVLLYIFKTSFLNYTMIKYKDIVYNHSGVNSNRSVFVVPRRAYLDVRVHTGEPRNIILILAEVHDDAVDSIKACEVNGFRSLSVDIIKEDTYWVRTRKPGHTHCAVIVQCMGLPIRHIVNGSKSSLIYMKEGDDFYSRVETEKPLIVNDIMLGNSRESNSIVACTTMYGQPERFKEWLKYQSTIGIDRVHLNVDASFMVNVTQTYPNLGRSLLNGFASVEAWKDIVGDRMYYYGQMTKYQDCLFRFMDTFEYGIFYDYDDFFNPMIPGLTNIHSYLEKFFRNEDVGSVFLPWVQMLCKPIKEKYEVLSDGNVTRALSGPNSTLRTQNKCIHRLKAQLFVEIHGVRSMLLGYKINWPKREVAYVAHIRHGTHLCDVTTSLY